MAYKRIVVATDGSASAETAEHVAASLASSVKARLTVAHAYTNPARADEAVSRALRIAEREGVRVETALSPDEPAAAVIAAAGERDADLIVIGSVGFSTSEQLFGSVSRKVVTHAPCDVLLTRARAEDERPHGNPPNRHLLIATDGSSTADRAARKGYALAKRLQRRYRNVHKDVTALMEWTVIAKDDAGRVFVPWDEIDVRWPLLKQAA